MGPPPPASTRNSGSAKPPPVSAKTRRATVRDSPGRRRRARGCRGECSCAVAAELKEGPRARCGEGSARPPSTAASQAAVDIHEEEADERAVAIRAPKSTPARLPQSAPPSLFFPLP
jgi:hypothetical protein